LTPLRVYCTVCSVREKTEATVLIPNIAD
jgi:hypothetical protein